MGRGLEFLFGGRLGDGYGGDLYKSPGSFITKYLAGHGKALHRPRRTQTLPDENQPQWEVDPIQAKPLKRRNPAREIVIL